MKNFETNIVNNHFLCRVEDKECNYPPVFRRWFLAQSMEIARKCVMPPTKRNPKDLHFVIKPSLEPVATFLIEESHKYTKINCSICKKPCFSQDPAVSFVFVFAKFKHFFKSRD